MLGGFFSAFGSFVAHLLAGIVLMVAFAFAYVRTTPHDEHRLIREGNAAAAIGLMGALIGFSIALSRAISVAGGVGDTLLWGLIALGVQVLGHIALRVVLPDLFSDIEKGGMAAGVTKGGTAIALGLVNAASLTP